MHRVLPDGLVQQMKVLKLDEAAFLNESLNIVINRRPDLLALAASIGTQLLPLPVPTIINMTKVKCPNETTLSYILRALAPNPRPLFDLLPELLIISWRPLGSDTQTLNLFAKHYSPGRGRFILIKLRCYFSFARISLQMRHKLIQDLFQNVRIICVGFIDQDLKTYKIRIFYAKKHK